MVIIDDKESSEKFKTDINKYITKEQLEKIAKTITKHCG